MQQPRSTDRQSVTRLDAKVRRSGRRPKTIRNLFVTAPIDQARMLRCAQVQSEAGLLARASSIVGEAARCYAPRSDSLSSADRDLGVDRARFRTRTGSSL
jgi:hypothetical protein